MHGDEYFVLTGDRELGPYTMQKARLTASVLSNPVIWIAKGEQHRVYIRVFREGQEYMLVPMTSDGTSTDEIPF